MILHKLKETETVVMSNALNDNTFKMCIWNVNLISFY